MPTTVHPPSDKSVKASCRRLLVPVTSSIIISTIGLGMNPCKLISFVFVSLPYEFSNSNIIGVFSASSKHEYAIRMYYSEEQRLWLAEYGPAFEQAVLGHTVLPFFEGLCQEFFRAWPEDEPEMLMEEERIADEEQRKIVRRLSLLDVFVKPRATGNFYALYYGSQAVVAVPPTRSVWLGLQEGYSTTR